MLNLPEEVREAVDAGRISEGHARALLSLEKKKAQTAALQTILKDSLNVRQTEELVRRLQGKRKKRRAKPRRDPEEEALEEELRDTLGTKVTLRRSKSGGTLTLHFYSDEELNVLVDRLQSGGS